MRSAIKNPSLPADPAGLERNAIERWNRASGPPPGREGNAYRRAIEGLRSLLGGALRAIAQPVELVREVGPGRRPLRRHEWDPPREVPPLV